MDAEMILRVALKLEQETFLTPAQAMALSFYVCAEEWMNEKFREYLEEKTIVDHLREIGGL